MDQGNHTITLNGSTTPAVYQSVFNSLVYSNTQSEPLGNTRSLEITVRDSVRSSEPLLITISIILLNDNCPTISTSNSMVNFSEGSAPLIVGSESGLLVHDDDFQFNSSIRRVLIQLNGVESIEMEGLDIYDTSTLVFARTFGKHLQI